MFHHGQIQQLAAIVGGHKPPRTTPVFERRTYGLFRGRDLLAIFVAGLHDDCIGWEEYYGKGLTVFMLMEHDVTARPDAKQVINTLKERY